jgi:O-antigen ligase/polysaccharide polymerase Wzy-like membrane protein
MTAGVIRRGGGLPAGVRSLAVLWAFVAWAYPAIALELGAWNPPSPGLWRKVLLLLVPLAVLALLGFRRRVASTELKVLAGAIWVVALAFTVAPRLDSYVTVLALPVLALSAMLSRWRPAVAIVIAFVLTGTYGSVEAYTPLKAGPLVEVMLVGMWLGVIFVAISRPRKRAHFLSPGAVIMSLYAVLTFLYVPFAQTLEQGLQSFRFSAWYILAFVVIAYAGWEQSSHRRAAKAIVVVAALVGAYATLRWAIGPSGKEKALFTETPYNTVAGGAKKVRGSFPSGAELGFWTAVLIPYCVAAVLGLRGKIRMVALVAVPLLAIGLMGSQMRAGLAAAVVGTAVVLIIHQLSRGFRGVQVGIGAAVLMGSVLAGIVIYPAVIKSPNTRARYSNLLHPSRDASYQERRFKWRTALADVAHHPVGRGLASAGRRRNYQRFATAGSLEVDNSYVKVAYEQGTPVMLLFIAGLVVLLLDLAARGVFARGPPQAFMAMGAAGALAALMIVLVTAIFIEFLPALAVWIMVGLALSQSVSREPQAQPSTSRPHSASRPTAQPAATARL